MSGKHVFNWRESDRSEHLAGFLLSALGMATPIDRQEDLGADFYCSLADQEKGAITFGFPFLVQIRSEAKPVVHLKSPKRYKHQKGTLPDHLSWFFRQELPVFLALVDKDDLSIRLYSLSPLWFLHHDHDRCPDPAALRLVPRLDPEQRDPVGPPVQAGQVTTSPESFEYEVDLGPPIASFTAEDCGNRARMTQLKRALSRALECELRNHVFRQAALPHFYWLAEAAPDDGELLPAFYHREAPHDRETLRQISTLLGPALLPLALHYLENDRTELVAALADLFREMPPDTFPASVREAHPALFTERPPRTQRERERQTSGQPDQPDGQPSKRKRWRRRRKS